MKLKILLTSLVAMAISASAIADINLDAQQAKGKLDSAVSTLQQMYDDKVLKFSGNAETDFLKAMMLLQNVVTLTTRIEAESKNTEKLDALVQEALMLQKILSAYFGVKEFSGYRLKQGAVAIEIDASGVFEKLSKRHPFLGVYGGGNIRFNPGEEIVTQFNALKTEFYGVLVQAAYYSKTDSRIKILAEWANNTKVIYPRETFGEAIMSTTEKWSLNLK